MAAGGQFGAAMAAGLREALRGRSGNRLDPGGQPGPTAPPGHPWALTRAALGRLERALSCSRCAGILREPVSLGRCEHVFCLSCVGDCVGAECPVCHMPAWVQDVQINRQLDNMIQLCSKLRHLLGADTSDSTECISTPTGSDSGNKSKKEQIKMWFSPRSRKIRCILNKGQPKTKGNGPCQDPSSAYHFFPSPPHEKPKPTKKPAQRQSKKTKKKRLADINKVWGLGKPEHKGGAEEKTSKEKCVTICSQPVVLCTPEPDSPKEMLPQEPLKEADSSTNMEKLEISPEVKSSEEKDNSLDACPAHVSKEKTCAAEESPSIGSETTPLKRGREQSSLPVSSQTKRCRRAEGSSSGSAGRQAARLEESPQGSPISQATEPKTPVQVSSSGSKLADTAMKTRSSAAMNSPSFPKSPSTPSTSKACNQVGTPHSPSVFKSPGGANAVARRNYKGETLLHVASIKGDLGAVEQLLKNGADPNVKDNAGWTPLHEACNHGHKAVVELLLQHKALVNTTGYQNDSPLHDAVKNGHVSIAELLLLHGASRDAVALLVFNKLGSDPCQDHDFANLSVFFLPVTLEGIVLIKQWLDLSSNIFGLRPVDYAESEKMKSVLMLPVKNESFSLSQLSESQSTSQARGGPLGILGSSLSSEQQKLLNKLVTVLKARRCTEFNSTVTHLVIPDVPMPSTVKYMMAVLTGCWVLKFDLPGTSSWSKQQWGKNLFNATLRVILKILEKYPEREGKESIKFLNFLRAASIEIDRKFLLQINDQSLQEGVRACLRSAVREQEEKYEIQGGPQRGRLNREQLLPKLFDGCYFYFLGSFSSHQKSDLVELVKAAGGQILVRQPKPDSDVTQMINTVAYHAESTSDQRFCTQYVIYDVSSKFKPEKIRQGKVWMAPSSWIIDCVMSFQLLPVK